jgi:hypothetical protein
VYPSAIASNLNGNLDLKSASLKVVLVDNSFVSSSSNKFLSDVTGTTSYVQTLTNPVIAQSANDQPAFLNADDAVFSNVTGTIRGCVCYLDTGVASTSSLVFSVLDSAPVTLSGSDYIITWNASGIIEWAVS